MGCLKLSYYEQGRALEVNPIFFTSAVEKKSYASKNCLSSSTYGFNGMMNDNEIKNNGNSVDFGARMYDPRLGRWFAVDPYFSLYTPISPYAFALNNPILFRDTDGRVVIGLDGNPVTFEMLDNGQIIWSANVTKDIKMIGEAMIKTPLGKDAFIAMQEMPTKITLIAVKGKHDAAGETYGTGKVKYKGEKYFKSANIYFYLDVIADEKNKYEGNVEEGINATGVHERWHLDPNQIKLDKKFAGKFETKKNKEKMWFYERLPYNAEYSAREQYRDMFTTNSADNWKIGYEKMTDSEGIRKPAYFGLNSNGTFKHMEYITPRTIDDAIRVARTIYSLTIKPIKSAPRFK